MFDVMELVLEKSVNYETNNDFCTKKFFILYLLIYLFKNFVSLQIFRFCRERLVFFLSVVIV